MKHIDNRLENIIQKLEEYSISLTNEEKDDLNKQLNRKSYLLYLEVINTLNSINELKEYQDIVTFIKLNIRIRNNVHSFIVSLEESIRSEYILKHNKTDYQKVSKKILNDLLNEMFPGNNDHIYYKIKNIRNDFSHLIYILLETTNLKKLFIDLDEISKLELINSEVISKLKNKIKKDIKDKMPSILRHYL